MSRLDKLMKKAGRTSTKSDYISPRGERDPQTVRDYMLFGDGVFQRTFYSTQLRRAYDIVNLHSGGKDLSTGKIYLDIAFDDGNSKRVLLARHLYDIAVGPADSSMFTTGHAPVVA